MGLIANITGQATGMPLEAARRKVAEAEEVVAAEAKRIAEAEDEVRQCTESIEGTSPDASAALAKLVGRRDAARGRAEALQARAARAADALTAARATLRQVELVAKRAEMDRLIVELRRINDSLTPLAFAFDQKVSDELTKAHELCVKANALRDDLLAAGESAEVPALSWVYWAGRASIFHIAEAVLLTERTRWGQTA
jgi:chromosome segregation ATPase